MKAKFIYESLDDIFKPKSEDDMVEDLKTLSKEERNERLILASKYGYKKVVQTLLDAGIDVNSNIRKITSLMAASYYGHIEIVQMLIDAGADVNIKNNNGWTAISFAAYSGNNEIKRILSDAGALPKCDHPITFVAVRHESGAKIVKCKICGARVE